MSYPPAPQQPGPDGSGAPRPSDPPDEATRLMPGGFGAGQGEPSRPTPGYYPEAPPSYQPGMYPPPAQQPAQQYGQQPPQYAPQQGSFYAPAQGYPAGPPPYGAPQAAPWETPSSSPYATPYGTPPLPARNKLGGVGLTGALLLLFGGLATVAFTVIAWAELFGFYQSGQGIFGLGPISTFELNSIQPELVYVLSIALGAAVAICAIVALSAPGAAQTAAGVFGLIGAVGYGWAVADLLLSDVPLEFVPTEIWVYRIGFLLCYLLGAIMVFFRGSRPAYPRV